MVQLTLHNGEDILINWDNVAFATPSQSEETRETFTKIMFTDGSTEVDVRETVREVASDLNIQVTATKSKTLTRKGK